MSYFVGNVSGTSPEQILEFVRNELGKVQEALSISDFLRLKPMHNPPNKTPDGLVVYADGTDWNPGSGEGIYSYYGGSWKKLG